jgi:3-deoxy-7-phosphoheptulonate synthase
VTVRAAGHSLGADSLQYVAGPCSVESEEQMEQVAAGLSKAGVSFLRGGTFKPRTSPYSFQGLKERGLKILRGAARRHGMASVTESTSVANIELVAKYADVIQIGARNMANYELLRAAGRTGMPVLLKRGFGATLDEWLNAAEYVAVSGSRDIVLCERGIRTFVSDTRNTLDLSAVPLVLQRSRLPVMVDVSHAAGRRDILAPLATAGFAAGACAVMIEVHPDPDSALSDSEQQITIEDFCALRKSVIDALRRAARSLLLPSELREHRKVEAKSAAQRAL